MTRASCSNTKAPELPSKARLAEMIEEATVDAYDESEQAQGWSAVLDDCLTLPFVTRVLGIEVQVTKIDLRDDNRLVALCSHGRERQAIDLADLPRPSPRPEGWGWVEAYRSWLGKL